MKQNITSFISRVRARPEKAQQGYGGAVARRWQFLARRHPPFHRLPPLADCLRFKLCYGGAGGGEGSSGTCGFIISVGCCCKRYEQLQLADFMPWNTPAKHCFNCMRNAWYIHSKDRRRRGKKSQNASYSSVQVNQALNCEMKIMAGLHLGRASERRRSSKICMQETILSLLLPWFISGSFRYKLLPSTGSYTHNVLFALVKISRDGKSYTTDLALIT